MFLLLALVTALTLGAVPVVAADDPGSVLESLDATRLDPDAALSLDGLVIESGLVNFRVERGTLFPTTPVGDRPREMVFVGKATLILDPPNRIEADQLEFHTGNSGLFEPVDGAVLVVCRDAASDALLEDRPPATPDPETVARARAIFDDWRNGGERDVVGARAAMLRDVLGDPMYDGYFAGLFSGERLGQFLVLVDPDAPEQVSVGQFVPIELTDAEKRRAKRYIRRQQRRDRLLGLSLDGLGSFDQWMRGALRDGAGGDLRGAPPFEATHYEMEITIGDSGTRIEGDARITIRPTSPGRRIVRLSMDHDVQVTGATDPEGQNLPVVQDFGSALVILPEAAGEAGAEIRVSFEGAMLEKIDGTLFRLRNTQSWYPHVGVDERATYDVTFHWNERFDLVAAGRRVDGEMKGDVYWERRAIDVPVQFFSFEIGRYDFQEETFGKIRVRFAFDRKSNSQPWVRSQMVATALSAMSYYEEVYGPYPLQDLTIVTAPRSFGQGLLTFVSLPSVLLVQDRLPSWLLLEDRRMVLAHELAHQWWGNMLGWESYRDQWLSEAMASHAASSWAAQLGGAGPPEIRSGLWQVDLAGDVSGRSIESIGPVVLGHRLDSSKADAMQPIVYGKGAVVLGMLEQFLGKEAFYETQKAILGAANYRNISTETYLQALEHMTGVDLDWFSERYIYGTGVPSVVYRHDAQSAENGTWTLQVEARLVPRYSFDYHVESVGDDSFDVRRTVRRSGDPERAALAVPFQIAVLRKDVDKQLLKKKNMKRVGDAYYNAELRGRFMLSGKTTRIELSVDHEPVEFWLDRDSMVLGYFIREERARRFLALQETREAEAAGDLDAAFATLEKLASTSFESGDSEDEQRWNESLRLEVELYRARLALDLGDVTLGRATLALAGPRIANAIERGVELSYTPQQMRELYRLKSKRRLLDARVQVLVGNGGEVLKQRRRRLMRDPSDLSEEELLLMAIAARQLGEQEVLDLAVEYARERGADPGLLVEERAAR